MEINMIFTLVGLSLTRTCFYEKFKDTKGVTRRHTSEDRQYNGQKKKRKK